MIFGVPYIWIRLEWHHKVNVEVKSEVSVMSRKIVDLVFEVKLIPELEKELSSKFKFCLARKDT